MQPPWWAWLDCEGMPTTISYYQDKILETFVYYMYRLYMYLHITKAILAKTSVYLLSSPVCLIQNYESNCTWLHNGINGHIFRRKSDQKNIKRRDQLFSYFQHVASNTFAGPVWNWIWKRYAGLDAKVVTWNVRTPHLHFVATQS